MSKCWLCDKTGVSSGVLDENEFCFARLDDVPVSAGHSEIVPHRHIESVFDATDAEILAMVRMLKKRIADIMRDDPLVTGYNIGINCGKAAGQSTKHLHIHLIPRRVGDVENPAGGGVRRHPR
ncbi:MAG: HIT family protein [Lactobacillales bacterium]|nr:HIT family protein [Lactobacillales bacterium]